MTAMSHGAYDATCMCAFAERFCASDWLNACDLRRALREMLPSDKEP
jgi:hypothetical protein